MTAPVLRFRFNCLLWFRRIGPNFGLALGIPQWTEFCRYASGNGGRLASCLKAAEVRPIAPRKWTAQSDVRLDRSIMNNIDRALIVGCALAVT
jgi:hypothetical protein